MQLHACSQTCSACQLSARNGSLDFTVDTSSPSSFSKRPRNNLYESRLRCFRDYYLPRLSVFRSGQLRESRFRAIHSDDDDDDDDVEVLTLRRVCSDNASSPVEPVAPWCCRRKINSRLRNCHFDSALSIALEDTAYATTTLNDYRERDFSVKRNN